MGEYIGKGRVGEGGTWFEKLFNNFQLKAPKLDFEILNTIIKTK